MPSDAANVDTILNAFSDLIAAKVAEHLAGTGREGGKVRKRLLTVEDAAIYLGRTKEAVQHLIAAGKLPTVKSDRRVFLDLQDPDQWINQSKIQLRRSCPSRLVWLVVALGFGKLPSTASSRPIRNTSPPIGLRKLD